jgi:predicted DNA-binding transcriptional regulator AlpA
MTENNGRRPARFVRKPEVAKVLQKTVKTVDRMNRRGELPKPVKLTNCSVYSRSKSLSRGGECGPTRSRSNLKTLRTDRRRNQRHSPRRSPNRSSAKAVSNPGTLCTAPSSNEEAAAVLFAQFRHVLDSMKALVADLDPIEALGVVYGLFDVLQPMIDETIAARRPDIKMPKGDDAYALAVSILASTPTERATLRQRRPPHLRWLMPAALANAKGMSGRTLLTLIMLRLSCRS